MYKNAAHNRTASQQDGRHEICNTEVGLNVIVELPVWKFTEARPLTFADCNKYLQGIVVAHAVNLSGAMESGSCSQAVISIGYLYKSLRVHEDR